MTQFKKIPTKHLKHKPIDASYVDISAMIADQVTQQSGYIYKVDQDYYEYLGTTSATINDYIKIGAYSSNNEVKTIYIDPNDLSGTGSIEQQICTFINTNIAIEYSKEYSKLNIILGLDPFAVEFPTITFAPGPDMEGLATYDGTWLATPWFELSSTPSNFLVNYQVSLSFGDLISTNVVPGNYTFGTERLQPLQGPFSTTWFVTTGVSVGDSYNNSLVLSSTNQPYTPVTDLYLPVRIRFYHIPTGTYGPYNIGTMEISYV
jgi:hypothetical protein